MSARTRSQRVVGFAALALSVMLIVSACNRQYIDPAELAARAIVSPCPPGLPAPSPTAPLPNASLTVRVQVEPSVATGTEVSLRIDGETTRNTTTMDAAGSTQLSVPKGPYTVRASLPGYTTVEGLARLTAGCEATMTIVLKKPTTAKR